MAILRQLLERSLADDSYDGVFYLKRVDDRRLVLSEASDADYVLRLKGYETPNVSCVFADDAFGNESEWLDLAMSVDPSILQVDYREDYEPNGPDWVVLLPWDVPLVADFWRRMPNDAWVAWWDQPALLEPVERSRSGEL